MAETLSVEAVNQMRIAMGLKPIPVPGESGLEFQTSNDDGDGEQGTTVDEREAMGSQNWQKLEEQRLAREAREKKKQQIKRQREQAARNAVIQGSGIAEVEDDLGATDWLKSMKKRQAKLSADETKRLQAQAKAQASYGAEDLAGIRVAHQLNDIGNEDAILTFKDRAIGEGDSEDEFELEDRELVEAEKLKKNLEAKKFKGYDPNSTEDGLLAKYDEEISGPKHNFVTLNGLGGTKEQAETSQAQEADRPRGIVVSLTDLLDDKQPISDYKELRDARPPKVKKIKSKKTARKRNRDEEDDDLFPTGNGAMDVDIPAAAPKAKKRIVDDFDDANEDLAAQLAKQRRQALKARKGMKASDIAKQIREEDASVMDATDTVVGEDDGLVIDETKEWAGALDPEAMAAQQADEEERRKRREASTHTPKPEAQDDDVQMGYAEAEEAEEAATRAARSPSAPPNEISTTGVEEEERIGEGLAATLKMLKDRQIVEGGDTNSESWSSKQAFLRERARREEDADFRARQARARERERNQGISNRDREEMNRQANSARDQHESRALSDLFNKEYKPNVSLKVNGPFLEQVLSRRLILAVHR
jgi:U4/U6.U5 tri-snRNP-associated protein 1